MLNVKIDDDIETIKVYQCEYVEKIVPKYTIK